MFHSRLPTSQEVAPQEIITRESITQESPETARADEVMEENFTPRDSIQP